MKLEGRTIIDPTTRREAIRANYDAFEALLPLLLAEKKGEFAVLRERLIAGFFTTAGDAQAFADSAFADGLFSIQRVEERAVDLGFYSHAQYHRFA